MSSLVLYTPPGEITPILQSLGEWMPQVPGLCWGTLLFLFRLGMMGCCNCCSKRRPMAKPRQTQAGTWSACSKSHHGTATILPWSQYPKEGVDLATFISRWLPGEEIGRRHHLAGRDFCLMLD